MFGSSEWRIRRLTDRAGVLKRDDRELIQSAMGKFSLRFPQLFVAVYTGSLGEVSNIRQFGFWLLNRSAFEDVPVEMPNEAGILLTIDPESKAAGLVFGYLVEPYLEEADTFECLTRAHGHWLEGRYTDGIIRVIGHLETVLMKRSRQARRDIESFQRKVWSPARLQDQIGKLRRPAKQDMERKEVES